MNTPSPQQRGTARSGLPPVVWWLGVACAIALIVAGAWGLVVALPTHDTVVGQATPATDARTVAQTFLTLQAERYNEGTLTRTPPPAAAAYAGVSCAEDLTRMRGDGATPPPLAPPHHFYRLAIAAPVSPDTDRQTLRITRTTLSTGQQDQQSFLLQRFDGTWRVCGLFPVR